jgi:membrane-bound lytic murein transglycosylase A
MQGDAMRKRGDPKGLQAVATALLLASISLSGCQRVDLPAPQATGSVPANALLAGVAVGPSIASPRLASDDAAAALRSFTESCPRLLIRNDASGLTQPADWQDACNAAPNWPASDAAQFFEHHFESVRIGSGEAFATGYYEPEIAGVRHRRPGFDVPVYTVPPDLIRAWPEETPPEQRTGNPPLGRYDENGAFVPYYDRAQIEQGALAGKGLEIAWAADPIELFFLQIQGSGRLLAPDGSVIRIGYAGQNGHGYTALGAIMREEGLLGEGPGQYEPSMQGIMRYLREHPAEGAGLMRRNESWVFFRELTGDGPLGALEVPVRAGSSVAADPNFIPLGAPVLLDLDRPEADGLWIAQDTGGAIKGPNRFDTFWGAGEEARTIAGGMSARGQALLLLPEGTLARLGTR